MVNMCAERVPHLKARDETLISKKDGERTFKLIPFSINFTTNQSVEESIVKLLIRKENVVGQVVRGHKCAVCDSNALDE